MENSIDTLTRLMDSWEETCLSTHLVKMENETVGGIDASKHGMVIYSSSNSLEALTQLANMARFITAAPPFVRPLQKTHFDDVATNMSDTPVIPLEAAKRASTLC
jgi:hypothetical protein